MEIILHLEPEVIHFYTQISRVSGIPLEQVLSDALFKLAGELSLEALAAGNHRPEPGFISEKSL